MAPAPAVRGNTQTCCRELRHQHGGGHTHQTLEGEQVYKRAGAEHTSDPLHRRCSNHPYDGINHRTTQEASASCLWWAGGASTPRPVTSPTRIELMNSFYARPGGACPPRAARPAGLLRRRPQRITFSTNWQLHQRLQQRADAEGRSLRKLISHLLEVAITR